MMVDNNKYYAKLFMTKPACFMHFYSSPLNGVLSYHTRVPKHPKKLKKKTFLRCHWQTDRQKLVKLPASDEEKTASR